MSVDLIMKMRARVEQCRRLAKMINDPQAQQALQQTADEAEADLRKLEAQEAAEMQIPQPRQT
jgi:hypothetical protein